MTYADVKKLSDEQRIRLYTSLADMYIQLRRLDFPSIGCLVRRPQGYQVRKRVNTIELNMQELEGLASSEIQNLYYGASGTLSSANEYVAMLLQIADNALSKGPGTPSQEEGEDLLYHLHIFRQYAEGWVDHSLDNGPFVLVHGDLEIFNLLLGHDMSIVSVLDWEWSHMVPRQFFKPPLWLSNTGIENMSYGYRYKDNLKLFDKFLAILRIREQERYGNELLADEWDKAKQNSGFMVANALENWTAMDWFTNRYINFSFYGGKEDLEERITAFIQDDPSRKAFIKKKVLDWDSYTAELEQLNTNSRDFDITKSALAAPDRKDQSASATQDFISWIRKISVPLLTRNFLFAIGAIVIISAGASYLSARRAGRHPFSR